MSERGAKILNFVGFQVNWFTCILAAAAGYPWIGPVVVGVLLPVHIAFARNRVAEAALICAAMANGYVFDSAVVLAGAFGFPEGAVLGGPTTLWMVAMWANFAATLRSSMGWLRGRYVVSALFGAAGGVVSYYAGSRFGAIVFPDPPWYGLALVGVEWLIAAPVLVWLAGALDDETTVDRGRSGRTVECGGGA